MVCSPSRTAASTISRSARISGAQACRALASTYKIPVPIHPKTSQIYHHVDTKLQTSSVFQKWPILEEARLQRPAVLPDGDFRDEAVAPQRRRRGREGRAPQRHGREDLDWQNFCNFLAGSFSAVSKRNFARRYAFDSIFQALQDLHTFAPLQSQNFSKKSV